MARRSKGRPINGVLLLDKQEGLSSNNVLQRAKAIYYAQKAGHTGALDPLATGMLPICFGEATKFSQFLLDTDKTYVVRAKLGVRTTTSDSQGDVVCEKPVSVTHAQIDDAIKKFVGETDQYPSMYSALKYEGRPLYKYAREGIEVPRKCRKINVFSLTFDEFDSETNQIQMTAHVSKGTYIRTIVDDLGELLGCGAHVIMLHRSKVGNYPSEQMVTLDQIQELLDRGKENESDKREQISADAYIVLDSLLLPMDTAVADLKEVNISEENGRFFANGRSIAVKGLPDGVVRVTAGSAKTFIGVGEKNSQGELKAKRTLESLQPQ